MKAAEARKQEKLSALLDVSLARTWNDRLARGNAHATRPGPVTQQASNGQHDPSSSGEASKPVGAAKIRGTKLLAPKLTQSDEAQTDRGSGSEADNTQQDVKPPLRNAVSAERDIAPLPCPPRDTTAAPSSDHGAPPGDVTAPARDGSAPRRDGRSPRRDAIKHPDDDGTSAARGSGGKVPPVDADRQVKKQESATLEAPGAILGGRQAADGRKAPPGVDDGGREETVRQRRRAEREAGAPKTLPPDAEVLEVNLFYFIELSIALDMLRSLLHETHHG